MIIRRKIYWHAAVIANASGAYNPELPVEPQKAASTLSKLAVPASGGGSSSSSSNNSSSSSGADAFAWLRTSAVDYIYGIKDCKPISINLLTDSVGVIDGSPSSPSGLRANNQDVAPGEIRFVLPPDVIESLFGAPIEVQSLNQFLSISKTPIRYRLFAVYRSGPGISCENSGLPNAYFSSETIPDEVVPSNDGASRSEMQTAMGPIRDIDASGGETGFYVKMKQQDPITRIGCCDIQIDSGGSSSSSSSSSSISIDQCPTTPVPSYVNTSNEYRIWMVRQNINSKFHGDPGLAELVYADLNGAIDTTNGNIDSDKIIWRHAGLINFEDAYSSLYNGMASNISYANESGKRSQSRILAPLMQDVSKGMPVHIQHIAWDNRGFLWSLCSGGFSFQIEDASSSGYFKTTEGIYRLMPGGWYNTSSKIYSWGGGNHGQKTAFSLIDGLNANIKQLAAGFVESNATSYFSFTVALDNDGYLHLRHEGSSSDAGAVPEYPDLNDSNDRYSEIDAGNSIICAVTNSGKLKAWNLADPNHPSYTTVYQQIVADINASTESYLHCAVSLSPGADMFVIASRADGKTVDCFPLGLVDLSISEGVITKVSAGSEFASALYLDVNNVGRVNSDGFMNSSEDASTLTASATLGKDVVDIDAGHDFLAICAKDEGSVGQLPLLSVIRAPIQPSYNVPDDLLIDFSDGIQASKVYCGLNRMISVDANDFYTSYGADNYAYSRINSSPDPTPDGGLGRSIATGMHAKDGVGGSRKYAVMAVGNTSDADNGSISIFVKYINDAQASPAVDQRPSGEWVFREKIYADQFSALLPSGEDMINSEFGYSVAVADNNDIIVGAPGKNKVCIIRKSTTSINYSASAVINLPDGLDASHRFGHIVKWMPLNSVHGIIIIGTPGSDGNTIAGGGALVVSAYSSTGAVHDNHKVVFANDLASGTYTGGKFGQSVDCHIPSIPVDGGSPETGRYNLAITDPVYKLVFQINARMTAADLMEVVGSVDSITPAGDNTGFATHVVYTHKTRASADRPSQLVISWAQNETIDTTAQQGIVLVVDAQITATDGTLHYSLSHPNQKLKIGGFPTTSGLIFGSQIAAGGGFVVVQGSIPTNPNVSHKNSYFIYKMSEKAYGEYDASVADGSPNPAFGIWEQIDIFNDEKNTSVIYPACAIFFMRNVHGPEILIGCPAQFDPDGHTKQGKIYTLPQYDYALGVGRRLSDVPASVKATRVSCAAIGSKHQVISAKGDEYYENVNYSNARMCSAASVDIVGAVEDTRMRVAVPTVDPVNASSPLSTAIYHFGSMAAFVANQTVSIPNYDTVEIPIHSDAAKTFRVAEMHWRPFKILDKPLNYETLLFEGDAEFKWNCGSTGVLLNPVIAGKSGAFSTPRLDVDGVSEADIDFEPNARGLIETAEVYYSPSTTGSTGSYIRSVTGSVSNGTAINPILNPTFPLHTTPEELQGVDFVKLFACSVVLNANDSSYRELGNCTGAKLAPGILMYQGHFPFLAGDIQTMGSSGVYPCRFGFTELHPVRFYNFYNFGDPYYTENANTLDAPGSNLSYHHNGNSFFHSPVNITSGSRAPDSLRLGRKVLWNTLSSRASVYSIFGKLKNIQADLKISMLQPAYVVNVNGNQLAGSSWHRYLTHFTDTVQQPSLTSRIGRDIPQDDPESLLSMMDEFFSGDFSPSHRYRPAACATIPNNYYFTALNTLHEGSWTILDGSARCNLFFGDFYKQHHATGVNSYFNYQMAFQDFCGRGMGVLISQQGKILKWNDMSWPVLRNYLSFYGEKNAVEAQPGIANQLPYNFHSSNSAFTTASTTFTDNLFNQFEPGWKSGNIFSDDECMIGGISAIPAPTQSLIPSYGIVTGRFSVMNQTEGNVSSSNSQISYLYSLSGTVSVTGTRSPVNFNDGTWYLPASLHAISSAGIYFENSADPAQGEGELVFISSATFSAGLQSAPSQAQESLTVPAKIHLWMQSRKFDGDKFISNSVISNTATTMSNPTNQSVGAGGIEVEQEQFVFHHVIDSGRICGSSILLKTVQNHTDISTWDLANGTTVVAIGARAFCVRRNAGGKNALASLISGSPLELNSRLSNPVVKLVASGSYYNMWLTAFSNHSLSSSSNNTNNRYGSVVQRTIESQNLNLALSFGGGIKFHIDGKAYSWYAGWVFELTPNISADSDLGSVVPNDKTAEFPSGVMTVESIFAIGPGTEIAKDFMQGFVSGCWSGDWLVIGSTRTTDQSIYIFKIENGTLNLNSSIPVTNIPDFVFKDCNVPFKFSLNIDSTGTMLTVCGHSFSADTDDSIGTGYANPDVVNVFTRFSSANPWSLSGNLPSSSVTDVADEPVTHFAETSTIFENGAQKFLAVVSGSDLAKPLSTTASGNAYDSATTDALRKRPGRIHYFGLNTTGSPSGVAECNDLLTVTTPGFVGSTYANLNFWCAVPMTAHNGTQSMVFSSSDNAMYFSTMGYLGALTARKEGAWSMTSLSNPALSFASVSAFEYPFVTTCMQCSTDVSANVGIYSAPRVNEFNGFVSGNISTTKRAMAYRPSVTPSLLAIDGAPDSPGAGSERSFGLRSVVADYASIASAPYMEKLNATPRGGSQWSTANGYSFSYDPPVRSFIKRYEFSDSPSFGNGLSLINGTAFSPLYAASFANCPPVWDADAQLWSWAGIRPIRLSSSHTASNTTSTLGPLMQLSYSDVFGLSSFSFNSSFIYAFRETVRGVVSYPDDSSDENKAETGAFRQTTVSDASGADISKRNGQIIRVNAPASLSGSIEASNIVDNFFTAGVGNRSLVGGPGSVMVAATNASSNARDTTRVCRSGIPLFARDRSVSGLGPVLILIEDNSSMVTSIPAELNQAIVEHDTIPVNKPIVFPFEYSVDDYPSIASRTSGSNYIKYSADSKAPSFERNKFSRVIKSIMRMLDPIHGDVFLGDELLIACTSALSPTAPSGLIYPSAIGGISFPFRCICRSELIQASTRIDTWKPKEPASDILKSIYDFSSASRGGLFTKVSAPSATVKFSHIVIFCSSFAAGGAGGEVAFAERIYNELTKLGSEGLLRAGGEIHIIDLNPSNNLTYKKALGEYGSYCTWRGGGW